MYLPQLLLIHSQHVNAIHAADTHTLRTATNTSPVQAYLAIAKIAFFVSCVVRSDACVCRALPVQHFPHANAGHDFAALLEQPMPTHSIADRVRDRTYSARAGWF